jgi:hypothetical protein
MQRQNMLERMYEGEGKAELKRNYRVQYQLEKEREIEEKLRRDAADKAYKDRVKADEERLATELQRHKLNELRDTKMRQQLRETSYELRELESKLKEAYVAKERHAQIAEKEAHKFDDMLEDAQIMKNMKQEAERAEREEQQRGHVKAIEMQLYRNDIRKQLEEKELAKQKAYEEFLKEKLLIDEIIRKIYEEDQREVERKLRARQATKEYIEEFKRVREDWKQRERVALENENRKIQEYAREQQAREDAQKVQKKQKEEASDKLQQQLHQQIIKEKEAREEMEKVRQELYLEEQEEIARNHEREEMERKIRQRLDLQRQNAEQIHYRIQRDQVCFFLNF